MSLVRRLATLQSIAKVLQPKPVILPFDSWAPDRARLGSPGGLQALNVIPTVDGFAPFKAFSVKSDALSARAIGATAAQNASGVVSIYSGDRTKLYSLSVQVHTDVSKSGGYATAEDGNWEYALFGTTLLATNFDDPVQGVTVGAGNKFSDHITSTLKPKARHIDPVRNHIVLGNTNDATDGSVPERRWWSAINSTVDFQPNADTLCDFDDARDIGWCQRIVGGVEYGLAFHERGIERMTFVGSPEIFRFDRIDRKRGTPIPNSVIAHGRRVFFISEEGFMYNDGTGESVHIGHRYIDREFWNEFDLTFQARLSAAIDPLNKLVLWGWVGSGASNNEPSEIYAYSWVENRWSHIQINHEILVRSLSQGSSLDELDAISTSLDTLPFSLDSRAYTGGDFVLAGYDTDHKYGFYDGSNLAATIDTTEVEFSQGRLTRIGNARPLVDGGSPTISIRHRNRQQDSVTVASAVSLTTLGQCPQNISARYASARMVVPAASTWSHAQGVQLEVRSEGRY